MAQKLKERKMKIFYNPEMEDLPFPEPTSYKFLVKKPESLGDINTIEGGKLGGLNNDGNLIKDVINERINTFTKQILDGFKLTALGALNISGSQTELTANAAVGATSIEVQSTEGVPSSGVLYLQGNTNWMRIIYTGKDGTHFTGIPTSGEGSITEAADSGNQVVGGPGVLITPKGIVTINSSGVETIVLVGEEGNAKFGGDISAASGKYLEPFVAGEDVIVGKTAAIVGRFTKNTTLAMKTDDAWSDEENPDTPNPSGNIWVCNDTGKKRYAFIKWNLADMPEDDSETEIISATLHIYCTRKDISVKITKVLADWAQATLKWSNQPARSGNYWAGSFATANEWYEMDILELYNEWQAAVPYGLAIEPTSGGADEYTHFDTGTYAPYIVVVYRKKESNKIYKATAVDGKCAYGFIGFFSESKPAGEQVKVAITGVEINQSSLEVVTKYYLSDTPGEISTDPGTVGVIVGKAISKTRLLIFSDFVDAEVISHKNFYRKTTDIYKIADAQVGTQSLTYVKKKELRLPGHFGTQEMTIYFELKSNDGLNWAFGRIYKNGSPIGTERSTTNIAWQTYTEDLTFQAGDRIQLWLKAGNSDIPAVHRHFRILGSADVVAKKYDIQTVLN